MKLSRSASGVLAIGIVAALTFVGGTPASAASAPGTTGPITVLPSAVAAGSGYTDAGKLGNSNAQAMAFLYKYATSDEVAAALRAKQAGQALTPAQTQVIATRPNTTVSYPTGAATNMAKANVNGAVGALAVYSNFQLGGQIGAAGTNFVSSMFGIDSNGLVCAARANASDLGSKALGFFSGQDCSTYGTPADFTPNTDASGAPTLNACNPATGACFSFLGSSTINQYSKAYCFNVSPMKAYPQRDYVAFQMWYRTSQGVVRTGATGGAEASDDVSIQNWCGGRGNFVTTEEIGYTFLGLNADPKTFNSPEPTYTPVVTGSADPERKLQCVILGSDGNTYKKDSVGYRESTGLLPDVQCPELPSGVIADTTKVLETGGDRTNELWSTKTPAEVRDALVKYPGCSDSTCLLELVKLGTTPLTTCHADPTGCEDWFTDPGKTSKYACTYGGTQVALEECTTYSTRWKPSTANDGKYLSDPKTGDVSPKPAGTPGGKSEAAMDPSVGDDRVSCLPGGFTLNPIDWVLAPLKCAFSPRASVVNKTLTSVGTAAAASPVGQVSTAVSGWSFVAPSSCDGLSITVAFPNNPFTIRVGQACPGDPLAPVANVVKWGVGATLLVVGFISIRNSIAGVAEYRGGA